MSTVNKYWNDTIEEIVGEDYGLSSDIMDAYAESRAYGDYEDVEY